MKKLFETTLLILTGCFILGISPLGLAQTSDEENVEVQEVMYVTDKLRLTLYKKPDANSGTLKLLTSGDVLEVIEKTGPYSRVRTDDGQIGWVKNGFLLSEKTDNLLLAEEQEISQKLQIQLEKFADTDKLIEEYETTKVQLQTALDELQQQFDQLTTDQKNLTEEKNALVEEITDMRESGPQISIDQIVQLAVKFWYAIAAVFLFLFLAGFWVGRAMVESQVRRRFQGVKVW